MKTVLRNIAAVLIGLFVGGMVNGFIVSNFHHIIPVYEGVDPNDMETIKSTIHLWSLKHFMSPLLAHALGTFVGALLAVLIAANHKLKFALGIGAVFFIGGTIVVFILPSPIWFDALDLIVAYIPMSWIAWKLASGKK